MCSKLQYMHGTGLWCGLRLHSWQNTSKLTLLVDGFEHALL